MKPRFLTYLVYPAALFILLLLGACANQEVESFSLDLYTRDPGKSPQFQFDTSISLDEQPGTPPEQEGLLLKREGEYSSPLYELKNSSQSLSSSNDEGTEEHFYLHLIYSSTESLQLAMGFESGLQLRDLPSGPDSPIEVLIPLGSEVLRTFRIFIPADKSAGRSMDASEDTAASAFPGFSLHTIALSRIPRAYSGEYRFLSADLASGKIKRRDSADEGADSEEAEAAGVFQSASVLEQYGYSLNYSFHEEAEQTEGAKSQGADSDIEEASYEMTSQEDGQSGEDVPLPTAELELAGPQGFAPYRLTAREGRHSVHFYSRDLDFTPHGLAFQDAPAGFQVEQLSLRPYSMYARTIPEPIPADPGVMLYYDQSAWRRSDWELFSWNLYPSILIFDFRDYDLQSAFLKRLAFFVEKKGSAGRLLSNKVLEPLHGWNAHDYRAADLARFFQLASDEDFELNPEEYLLRDILLDKGIIRQEDGRFLEGEGGILSLSQESSDRLRYLFMTHEGYHGFYFASREYRDGVHRIWEGLSEDERQFWKIFLDWKWYNTEDEELVINELQAYLMQQHLSYVDTYFKEYTIPRFLRRYPEYNEKAEYFLAQYPEHFTATAQKIEDLARRVAGIGSGDLLCLRRGESRTAESR